MIDETDLKILNMLKENSRIQWREIGDQVHLTGQAVSNRIHKMEQLGIIEKYTICLNESKIGHTIRAFITVFMKTADDHRSFLRFIKRKEGIVEMHRTSGESCYLIICSLKNEKELLKLLDDLLCYGNYKLSLSINKII